MTGPPSATYQNSISRRAIEELGAIPSSPASIAARSWSRENQRASPISSSSTAIRWPGLARAVNPSIRLRGIGHGWLPRYWTWSTTIDVSSKTSRATACSADSPGSTNPATTDIRFGGQSALRASMSRSSGSTTSMITAGSRRGKCSVPSAGQVVSWPAGAGTVAVPHCGQWVCDWCHRDRATAWVSNPESRSLSSAPADRRGMGLASGDSETEPVPSSPAAFTPQ